MADYWKGRNAIVTGGSRGIGAQICLALAAKGCNILFNYNSDNSKSKAQELVAQIEGFGAKAHAIQCDVARADCGQVFLEAARHVFGQDLQVHILVHNAGISINAGLQDITAEGMDSQWHVNVRAPVLITQSLQPHMVKKGNGRIIILSSVSAQLGQATKGVYSATKIAIENFAQTWTNEFGKDDGITINCLEPGPVITDMWNANTEEFKATFDQRCVASTKEISDLVLMLCSAEARWCNGCTLNANNALFN